MRLLNTTPSGSELGHRRHRRSGLVVTCFCYIVGLWGALGAVEAQDIAIQVTGDVMGLLPKTELSVGDSLFVWSTGLPAGRSIDVVLLDQAGSLVRSERVQSDADGVLSSVLLWARTGVKGCDDGTYAGYPFETFAEAEAVLEGTSVTIALWDVEETSVLATASVPIVAQSEARVFVADAALCPLQLAERHDPLFLVTDDAMPAPIRVFVVRWQPVWAPGMPLADVRAEYPQGQLIPKSTSGTVRLLAVSGALPPGRYDVIVRPDGPMNPRIEPNDTVLVSPPPESFIPVTSNGGLTIDPWGHHSGSVTQ